MSARLRELEKSVNYGNSTLSIKDFQHGITSIFYNNECLSSFKMAVAFADQTAPTHFFHITPNQSATSIPFQSPLLTPSTLFSGKQESKASNPTHFKPAVICWPSFMFSPRTTRELFKVRSGNNYRSDNYIPLEEIENLEDCDSTCLKFQHQQNFCRKIPIKFQK